ncbi:hypothetical protein PFDG_05287 [Plasmodium falciparum Dd2]|uniref:Uncharacterized protein n=1 Tax=Plasmodium falciparum (isolate Dd2) TaxID=57267 RepID=A0A0L7MA49_PLAF4|nr:hypothetical protein PFDG_05287 [Plasmodium falciparum Dd2]
MCTPLVSQKKLNDTKAKNVLSNNDHRNKEDKQKNVIDQENNNKQKSNTTPYDIFKRDMHEITICTVQNLNYCIDALFERTNGDIYSLPFKKEKKNKHPRKKINNNNHNHNNNCNNNNSNSSSSSVCSSSSSCCFYYCDEYFPTLKEYSFIFNRKIVEQLI